MRKFSDFKRAANLIQEYPTEKIFESFVNSTNYRGRGIVEGARNMLGKDINDLSLSETAMVVILGQAPGYMNRSSIDNASYWADHASGVVRRMEENGFISIKEKDDAIKEIYEKIFPSTADSDIDFLKQYASGLDQNKLDQFKQQYDQLPFQNRWKVVKVNGVNEDVYIDFYTYLGQQIPGLSRLNLTDKYFPESGWKGKYPQLNQEVPKETVQDSAINYHPESIFKSSLPGQAYTGFDFFPGKDFQPATDYNSYKFDIIQKEKDPATGKVIINTNGLPKDVTYNLVYINNQNKPVVRDDAGNLFIVENQGLTAITDAKIMVRSDNGQSVMVSQAVNRPGVVDTSLVNMDAKQLLTDANDDYYQKEADGKLNFIGHGFKLESDKEVVVNVPNLNLPLVATDQQTRIWATVVNALKYTKSDIISQEEGLGSVGMSNLAGGVDNALKTANDHLISLIKDKIPPANDPNLGLYEKDKIVTINPKPLETTLHDLGEKATAIEIQKGFGDENKNAVLKIISDAVTNNKPVLIWLNTDQYVDVKSIDADGKSQLLGMAKNEYPVMVLGQTNYHGQSFIFYQDPTNDKIQFATWDKFANLATPTQVSHYKLLVMDDVKLDTKQQQMLFDYGSSVNQLELAETASKDAFVWKDPNGQIEKMTTINPNMQNFAATEAKNVLGQFKDTTEVIAIAMDQMGNMIFNVGLDKDGKPLPFNASATESFTPGSTFKLATSLWALNNGLDPKQEIAAGGAFYQDGIFVKNWNSGAKSEMNLDEALATSNNAYFYGITYNSQNYFNTPTKDFDNFIQKLGFAQSSLNMPGLVNKGGFLGTDAWAQQQAAYNYKPLPNSQEAFKGIGQGELRVTPMEMLRLVGAIANNGTIIEPNVVKDLPATVSGNLPNKLTDIQAVQKGMHMVTSEAGMGSAEYVFNKLNEDFVKTYNQGKDPKDQITSKSPITVYGKTGTAELGGDQTSHAWFVGYAKNEITQEVISFAFILKNGGSGSAAAAPLAEKIIEQYFLDMQNNQALGKSSVAVEKTTSEYANQDSIGKPITDSTKIENIMLPSWKISEQPNSEMIKSTIFLDDIINNYQDGIDSGQIKLDGTKFMEYLQDQIKNSPYSNLLQSETFSAALRQVPSLSMLDSDQEMTCVNKIMLLAAMNLPGNKSAYIGGFSGSAVDIYNQLASRKEGEAAQWVNVNGEVNAYAKYTPKSAEDYQIGDVFFEKYSDLAGHVGTILSITKDDRGKIYFLISDSNYNPFANTEAGEHVSDGRSRTRWVSYEEFYREYKNAQVNPIILRLLPKAK